jgi:hypothetical protein
LSAGLEEQKPRFARKPGTAAKEGSGACATEHHGYTGNGTYAMPTGTLEFG